MIEPVLALDSFGLAFGANVVLASLTLAVPATGITVLMGPVATGKSSLRRGLAGANDAQPTFRTWGQARYAGAPLGERGRPALVQQNARLLTATVRENVCVGLPDRARLSRPEQTERITRILETLGVGQLARLLDEEAIALELPHQRLLSLARAYATGAPLLLVDEPTAGLSPSDAECVLDGLVRAAADRAVLVSTHNRAHAERLGGTVVVIAGGRLLAVGSREEILAPGGDEHVREFLETGGSSLPSPNARVEDLAPGVPPPPPLPAVAASLPRAVGPRHFYWLLPDQLAGVPRPGILRDVEADLGDLVQLGVTTLVCLEEEALAPELLARFGLRGIHAPVIDMRAPTLEAADEMCRLLDQRLAAGERVAVHCLAGLGRTGTVLAIYLVHRGATALEAIDRVRSLRPLSIQTDEQAQAVARYEAARASSTSKRAQPRARR